MTRLILAVLLLGSLLAAPVARAQDPKPAAESSNPAAKPEPGPGQEPDPAIIQGIMTCLADGLPPEWRKTWFTIVQTDSNTAGNARSFQADFFFTTSDSDSKGQRLKPCGGGDVLDGVGKLNAYLTDAQKRWTSATFTFYRDGRYDASYDLTPFKPKPEAAPAAKPKAASKKKQETAK